jgi:DNA mismatch endonuclease, patch repair protein
MRRNRQRDKRSTTIAQELGWTVIRVWECAVRADPHDVARQVLKGRQPGPDGVSAFSG